MNSKLYFAYGSNLNARDWQRHCQEHGIRHTPFKIHSKAYLPDHEIAFTYNSNGRKGGVLDILPKVGHAVPGVVFEADNQLWTKLDHKEGCPNAYERISTTAIARDGTELQVHTYRVVEQRRERFVEPTNAYVEIVRDGLKAHALPESALESAMKNQGVTSLIDGVFPYGTLMREESRFQAIEAFGIERVSPGQTHGKLIDLGSFPGLVDLTNEASMVQGDFFRIRDLGKLLTELDQIEGFRGFGNPGSLFARTIVSVDIGNDKTRQAWAYRFAGDPREARVIPSGSWREHQGRAFDILR